MSFQTAPISRYPDLYGPPGSRFGSSSDRTEVNRHNAQTERAGVWSATATYAETQTVTLTINSIAIAVATTTDAATTRAALVAALQANADLARVATFASGAAGLLTVTELFPGAIRTITGAATGGAALAVAVTTAAIVRDAFDAGLIVLEDVSVPNAIILPRSAGTVAGLAALRHNGIDRRRDQVFDYEKGSQVLVARKGEYIVRLEATSPAVTRATTPFYRITQGVNGLQLGAIRGNDDGGAATTLTGRMSFLAEAQPGALVPVSISLP